MQNILEQVTAPLIKRNIRAMSEKDLANGHICAPVRFIWKPATAEDAIGAMSMALTLLPFLKSWFPIGGRIDLSQDSLSDDRVGFPETNIIAHVPLRHYNNNPESGDGTDYDEYRYDMFTTVFRAARRHMNRSVLTRGELWQDFADFGVGLTIDTRRDTGSDLPERFQGLFPRFVRAEDKSGFGDFYKNMNNCHPIAQREWKTYFVKPNK